MIRRLLTGVCIAGLLAASAQAQSITPGGGGGGSGISALTGDCTASGTGSVAITCTKLNGVSPGTAWTQNTGTSGATIPFLNGVNTFTNNQTFATALVLGSGTKLTGLLTLGIATAPTITSGFGSGATITDASGTFSFVVNIGTTPGTAGILAMPAGTTHGFHCQADDLTTTTIVAHQTGALSTSAVTLTFYGITTGVATAPPASDVIAVSCTGL